MRVGGCGNVVHVDEIVPRTPAYLVISAEPEMMPTAAAAFDKSLFSLVGYVGYEPWARFTKYLTTILRLSYDNAKVTINLRRTSNLQNILQ